jgi:hypothetical protein
LRRIVAFWERLLPALSVAVTVILARSRLRCLSARLTALSFFFASFRRSFVNRFAATDRETALNR